jgi:hypothetical protein
VKRAGSGTRSGGTHAALCLAAGFAVLAPSRSARAQDVDDLGAYGRPYERGRQIESAQHLAVELRFGRYIPNIDNEFETATPYETMFGNGNRYAVGLEVDWQAFRIPYVGTFGIGGAFQYTKSKANSFEKNTDLRSGETTALTLFPLYAVAVLRADYLARETPIPLVGYVKAGVGAGIWTVSNGVGTARVGDVVGSGISYGPQGAIGGMLLLDPFDPSAAMQLDESTGINNSYLFIEWYVSQLNGFGSSHTMQVGTNTWFLGLAFEM